MSADAGAVGPVRAPFGGNARLVRQTCVVLFGLPVNYGQDVYRVGGDALYRCTTCLIPFVDPGTPRPRLQVGGNEEVSTTKTRAVSDIFVVGHASCTRCARPEHTTRPFLRSRRLKAGGRYVSSRRNVYDWGMQALAHTNAYARCAGWVTDGFAPQKRENRCLDSIFTLSLVEQSVNFSGKNVIKTKTAE